MHAPRTSPASAAARRISTCQRAFHNPTIPRAVGSGARVSARSSEKRKLFVSAAESTAHSRRASPRTLRRAQRTRARHTTTAHSRRRHSPSSPTGAVPHERASDVKPVTCRDARIWRAHSPSIRRFDRTRTRRVRETWPREELRRELAGGDRTLGRVFPSVHRRLATSLLSCSPSVTRCRAFCFCFTTRNDGERARAHGTPDPTGTGHDHTTTRL